MPFKVVDKTQIVNKHIFEAMYFGVDNHYFNLAVKCINKDIYLKAIKFANIKRRLNIAEDILASTAILGVSEKIALLDSALYYYCYNASSATRAIEPHKIKERIENLRFVASKFEEFARKGDEGYGVFVMGLSRILQDLHIPYNQTQQFIAQYQNRIEKGWPRWLARFIWSLQKKPIKVKQKQQECWDFIKYYKSHFHNIDMGGGGLTPYKLHGGRMKSSTIPKFSIIITIYNSKHYLARALQSCINQTYENIEIVCVDDCGVDKGIEIAREFALQDDRIKIIQNQTNIGTFLTRNRGAMNANGEYLFFLDADDYLHLDACKQCYEILQNDTKNTNGGGQIDFIIFNFLLQMQHNGTFNILHRIKQTKIIDNYTFEAMYLGSNASFHIATKCVKKDTYLKAVEFANIYQKKLVFAEDILISTAILGVSKKIALLDSALYYYSYNNTSITRINHSEQTKIKIENLKFIISKLEQLAYKKDKYYKVFVLTLCKMLEGHIITNQMSPLLESYHRRIAKGYPRFIVRPILSLQKKYFKKIKKQQEKEVSSFINNNKYIFEPFLLHPINPY